MSECILEFKKSTTFLIERTIVSLIVQTLWANIYNCFTVEFGKVTVTGRNFTG